jgi:hypothetical protein
LTSYYSTCCSAFDGSTSIFLFCKETGPSMGFLDKGKIYFATTYCDGKNADYRYNPQSYAIEMREVTSEDSIRLHLAPLGQRRRRFIPICIVIGL